MIWDCRGMVSGDVIDAVDVVVDVVVNVVDVGVDVDPD